MTFTIITGFVLFLIYAGYLLSKIGDGTVWAPWRLPWHALPLIWLLFFLLPWAGQSLIHFALGFAGVSPDDVLVNDHLPMRLMLLAMVGPLLETVLIGAIYATSRVIPSRFRPDMIFVLLVGVVFVFLHKGHSPLNWAWYFIGFTAQAWLYVFLQARAGHVKAWLVISVGHGLANIGIICATITTAALRAMR